MRELERALSQLSARAAEDRRALSLLTEMMEDTMPISEAQELRRGLEDGLRELDSRVGQWQRQQRQELADLRGQAGADKKAASGAAATVALDARVALLEGRMDEHSVAAAAAAVGSSKLGPAADTAAAAAAAAAEQGSGAKRAAAAACEAAGRSITALEESLGAAPAGIGEEEEEGAGRGGAGRQAQSSVAADGAWAAARPSTRVWRGGAHGGSQAGGVAGAVASLQHALADMSGELSTRDRRCAAMCSACRHPRSAAIHPRPNGAICFGCCSLGSLSTELSHEREWRQKLEAPEPRPGVRSITKLGGRVGGAEDGEPAMTMESGGRSNGGGGARLGGHVERQVLAEVALQV
eukprot:COSAG01_NODE_16341_length_1244_cov_6.049782_1_plen_351_part_01